MSAQGEFQSGDYVETTLGKAHVIKSTPTGVQVRLEAVGLDVHLHRSKVRLIKRASSSLATGSRPSDSSGGDAIPTSQTDAATAAEIEQSRTLEALRFGLVPTAGLPALTLGYEDLRRWVLEVLPEKIAPKPVVEEIVGPFGAGKSHTMAAIRHIAREAGFLTCHAEVDGTRVSLCNPKALLFALLSTLDGKDLTFPTPLLDVYIRAILSGLPAPKIAPVGIDRVHDNFQIIRLLHRHKLIGKYRYMLDAILCSSAEYTASEVKKIISQDRTVDDSSVYVRSMIGQAVQGRPYDFVASLAGHAIVASFAGYRGLVVTIDELEVDHLMSRSEWGRVALLLETLDEYLNGRLAYPPAPLGMFFATVPQSGAVGDTLIDRLVNSSHGAPYQLASWSLERYKSLAKRIHEMYITQYGLNGTKDRAQLETIVRNSDRNSSGDGQIRVFIKKVMAQLDLHYGPPGNHG